MCVVETAHQPTPFPSRFFFFFFFFFLVSREQKRGYKDQWPFSVRIYKDDSTGKPKGDCIIKYEEPNSAHAALKWFDGIDFKGGKIGVAMAAKPSLNNRY